MRTTNIRDLWTSFGGAAEGPPVDVDTLRFSNTTLPHNAPLADHLRMLRAKGAATDAEAHEIVRLAGRLSFDEEAAIRSTVVYLAANKGLSEAALYELAEFGQDAASRRTHDRGAAWRRGLFFGTTSAATLPLIFTAMRLTFETSLPPIHTVGAIAATLIGLATATKSIQETGAAIIDARAKSYGRDD